MEWKVKVSTPKGEAEEAKSKIVKLIGCKKNVVNTYVNKENDELWFEMEGSVKDYKKNVIYVNRFEFIMKTALKSKAVKLAMRRMTKEDKQELMDLCNNQTSMEIIKEATAEELVEGNKTMWQNIKEKFKKVD